MAFKKGDTVRYAIPDIVGEVKGAAVDDDANLLLLVEYLDAEGEVQQRYFKAEQLQAA